jgi:hypothetical protein
VTNGADALIVTINPQWLYGRLCLDVSPPHARYACLLEVGPVTGDDAIVGLASRWRRLGCRQFSS